MPFSSACFKYSFRIDRGKVMLLCTCSKVVQWIKCILGIRAASHCFPRREIFLDDDIASRQLSYLKYFYKTLLCKFQLKFTWRNEQSVEASSLCPAMKEANDKKCFQQTLAIKRIQARANRRRPRDATVDGVSSASCRFPRKFHGRRARIHHGESNSTVSGTCPSDIRSQPALRLNLRVAGCSRLNESHWPDYLRARSPILSPLAFNCPAVWHQKYEHVALLRARVRAPVLRLPAQHANPFGLSVWCDAASRGEQQSIRVATDKYHSIGATTRPPKNACISCNMPFFGMHTRNGICCVHTNRAIIDDAF